jgi:hypothetical protein
MIAAMSVFGVAPTALVDVVKSSGRASSSDGPQFYRAVAASRFFAGDFLKPIGGDYQQSFGQCDLMS